MDTFHLDYIGMLLILAGVFAEGCSFWLYRRAKFRLKKLSGTGRVADIEIAHNWHAFFRLAMVAVPVLLYLLMSNMLAA